MSKKFTYEDRLKLEEALNNKKKVSQIAEELKYSSVTIYNEIKRGLNVDNKYSAAIGQYDAQKAKANQGKKSVYENNTDLMQEISDMVGNGTSILKVAELMRNQNQVGISAKTIYNYKKKGLLVGIAGDEELGREIPLPNVGNNAIVYLSRAEANKDYLSQGIHEEPYEKFSIVRKYKSDIAFDLCKYTNCDYTKNEITKLLKKRRTILAKDKQDTLLAFGICDAMKVYGESLGDVANIETIRKTIRLCYDYMHFERDKNFPFALRTISVEGKTYPIQLSAELERLQKWIENSSNNYPTIVSAAAVYEQALLIYPYENENINKLFAHFLMNSMLVKGSYLPLSYEEVEHFYKSKKQSFLEHLLEVEIYKLANWHRKNRNKT